VQNLDAVGGSPEDQRYLAALQLVVGRVSI
jgi:hypothetical protein